MKNGWRVLGRLALVAMLLPACRQEAPSPQGAKTSAVQSLELVAMLDKLECHIGETVTLDIELRNNGDQDRRVTGLRLDAKSIDVKVKFLGKIHPLQRYYPNRSRPIGPREVLLESRGKLSLTLELPAIQAGTYELMTHFHGRPHLVEAAPVILTVKPVVVEGEEKDRLAAVIQTELGTVELKLFAKEAFGTVFNFVHRARSGAFDGVRFHKLTQWPVAVAQAGERGDGPAQELYSIPTEPNDIDAEPGMVAMGEPVMPSREARPRSTEPGAEDASTGGSHFFFYLRKPAGPQPTNTVFAKVVAGMWVINKIHKLPTKGGPEAGTPLRKIRIKSVTFRPW